MSLDERFMVSHKTVAVAVYHILFRGRGGGEDVTLVPVLWPATCRNFILFFLSGCWMKGTVVGYELVVQRALETDGAGKERAGRSNYWRFFARFLQHCT